MVGEFANPWKHSGEEALAIRAWKWAPGSDTFRAVVGGNTTQVSSLSSFLGAIERQKPQTIDRINVFSHGNPGVLPFSGTIDKNGGVMLNTGSALDLRIRDTEPIPIGPGRVQETPGGIAQRLRNRFTATGQIVLFLCNSGADFEVLQAVADAFGVKVSGFGGSVYYCPVIGPGASPSIDRGFTSLDKCATKSRGFQHLVPTNTRLPIRRP